MAANAQYAATPRVGSALLTTADTSLTAPSTVGTVLAAGSSGTRIDYIDIQGVATTAAGIIKEAILRLYFKRYEEAGQYLRLQVHDEIMMEVPEDIVDKVDLILTEEMEKPILEMRMSSSWKMGEYLTILTESKKGKRWGIMK